MSIAAKVRKFFEVFKPGASDREIMDTFKKLKSAKDGEEVDRYLQQLQNGKS